MKKLAIVFSLMFAAQACAQTEHEDLSDVPPTYDLEAGRFFIDLPMICSEDSSGVFSKLNSDGYKMSFLGQTKSMAGGELYVSVFVHPKRGNYYVLLTNKETGGVCEVTSGQFGQAFNIDGTNI